MAFKPEFNMKVALKLIFWSLVVGFLLKYFGKTASDIYGAALNSLAKAFDWLTQTGFEYILLGAAIVVPIYLFSEWRKSRRHNQ